MLERAIHYAVDAHSGAVRKLGNAPYILHPLEATVIASTLTSDPEVLAAMALHDVVEDAGATLAELEEKFGPRVAALVASETEDKRPTIPPSETWRIRKEESIRKLRASDDPAVKIIWMGDKLSNMRSIYAAWRRDGSRIWRSFNQSDPAQHAWYYRSVAEALGELWDTPAWREYARLVDAVFADTDKEDE